MTENEIKTPAIVHLLDQRLGALLADDKREMTTPKALFAGMRALGLLGGRGWCGTPVSFLEAASPSLIEKVTCVQCLRIYWINHQVPVTQAEQRMIELGHPPAHSHAFLLALARRLFDAHWKASGYSAFECDVMWKDSADPIPIQDHWLAVAREAVRPQTDPPPPSACEHRNVDRGADEFTPDRCRDCFTPIFERIR